MKPSYGRALAIGAAVGLVLALAITVFAGATGGVPKLTVIGEGTAIEPSIASPASALWVVAVLSGAVGGALLSIITRAIARIIDPEPSTISLVVLVPVSMVIGAAITMSVLPLGATLLGSIADGTVTVSIVGLLLLVSVIGIAAGAVVTWFTYLLSRPPAHVDDPELLSA